MYYVRQARNTHTQHRQKSLGGLDNLSVPQAGSALQEGCVCGGRALSLVLVMVGDNSWNSSSNSSLNYSLNSSLNRSIYAKLFE